jgi:kynurenine formamidase
MCHNGIRETILSQGVSSVAYPEPTKLRTCVLPPTAGHVIDLTHPLYPEFPTYFGESDFSLEREFDIGTNGLNLNRVQMREHVGTHLDAPLHFSADGLDLAELPIENLVVPLVVIDIRSKSVECADAQLTPEDVVDWTKCHGPLPPHCCVAMQSGWTELIDSSKFRGHDGSSLHFPGFHLETVQMLLDETSAVGIAVDTLSLDYGRSKNFEAHAAWLPTGRWGLECVALHPDLPATGAILVAGAMKIRGGTGGPTRVLAFMP